LLARVLGLERAALLVEKSPRDALVPVAVHGDPPPAPLAPGEAPDATWSLALPVGAGDRVGGLLLLARAGGAPLTPAERALAAGVADALAQLVASERQAAELRQTRELLGRADRLSALGMLAAGVAHEIRNPLVSVRTFIQLLPERLADEEFRTEFRELALGEIERICVLINDLLVFSRPAPAEREPTDLNELRAAYLRNYSHMLPAQYDQDLNSKYGLPYPIAGPFVGGLTLLQISGFTSIGTTSTFFQIINKYELNDSYTAIRGGHVLKFGFRGASKTFYNQINCNGCRGILTFNGAYTRQPGFNATGSAVADFLTGVVSGAQLRNLANEKDVGRDLEGFAQDRWRISARLSLTLGVRYQFNPPNWEARDSFSSVLFSLADKKAEIVVPAGQRDSDFNLLKNVLFPYITVRRAPELDRNLVHNTYKNFAPRLGLAWQVDPKTVVRGGYGIFYGFTDVVSQVPTLNPPTRVLFSATANNIDPTLVIDRSAFGSNLFSRPIDSPGYNAVRDPNVHPDLTQMYNLSVQREFLSSWLLEVGFMGNRSSRVLMITQINDAVPALPSDTSSIQSRRRVSTLLGPIQYMVSQGFSNYNALTVNVEKRMARGFSVLANYTWSRALGVAPALSEGINSSAIQSPVNLKREYGPLEFDIMRRLAVSYLIELPFGKGKPYLSRSPRAVDLLFGGWQLSGITTLQGGFPLTPALSSSLGKTETNSRPNAIGDPSRTSRRPDDWLSRAAFAVPTDAEVAAGNFFGDAGTGSIRAPGLVNFDFSVGKNFAIREGMRLQLRTEFFNLTNTPFFGLPGGVEVNFNSQNFGKVIAAGDPRIVQFGLKLVF